jgi:hypothetical protein
MFYSFYKMSRVTGIILSMFMFALPVMAQTGKKVNHQPQAWFSLNTTAKVVGKWGFVADLHERRTDFISKTSFHFARIGVNYWLRNDLTVTAGYAHLWLAPTTKGFRTFANENRVYQQVQLTGKIEKIQMLQRLRNEQRWQQKLESDQQTGQNKFTDRIRYLLSFTIPVCKNKHYPALVLSDELCVQMGKEVVNNTFDQNRLFVGIKQPISNRLSFDFGYLLIHQQKTTGYQYDKSDILRCFFYYTPDFRKSKGA